MRQRSVIIRCLIACPAICSTLNLLSCWFIKLYFNYHTPDLHTTCVSILFEYNDKRMHIQKTLGWAVAVECGWWKWASTLARSLFKHDICSNAQAVWGLGRHAALCDVVGVQAQMLQMGEVGGWNVLAETSKVEFCKEIKKMDKKVLKLISKTKKTPQFSPQSNNIWL